MTDTWLLLLLRQEAQKSVLYLPFFKVLFVWGVFFLLLFFAFGCKTKALHIFIG